MLTSRDFTIRPRSASGWRRFLISLPAQPDARASLHPRKRKAEMVARGAVPPRAPIFSDSSRARVISDDDSKSPTAGELGWFRNPPTSMTRILGRGPKPPQARRSFRRPISHQPTAFIFVQARRGTEVPGVVAAQRSQKTENPAPQRRRSASPACKLGEVGSESDLVKTALRRGPCTR